MNLAAFAEMIELAKANGVNLEEVEVVYGERGTVKSIEQATMIANGLNEFKVIAGDSDTIETIVASIEGASGGKFGSIH